MTAHAGEKLDRGTVKALTHDQKDLEHKLKVFDAKHASVGGKQSEEFRRHCANLPFKKVYLGRPQNDKHEKL